MKNSEEILEAFMNVVTDEEAKVPQKVTNRALFVIVANTRRAIDQLDAKVDESISSVNGHCFQLEGQIIDIKDNHLPHIQNCFETFRLQDFDPLKKRIEYHPSLVWLLKNQTSKTIKSLCIILVVLMVLSSIIWTIVPLRSLILHWLGLPDSLLDSIVVPTPIP